MSTASTPPTPADVVAAALAEAIHEDYEASTLGWAQATARGNVLDIVFTPYGDGVMKRHAARPFRAVVVEGTEAPTLLDGPAYFNTDDGSPWLTCSRCDKPLTSISGGDVLAELNAAVAEHAPDCPGPADQAETQDGEAR